VGVNNHLGDGAYGPMTSTDATLVWPFGVPDNDIAVVRSFASKVLGLRQIADFASFPLPQKFAEAQPSPTYTWSNTELLKTGDMKLEPGSDREAREGTITADGRDTKVLAYRTSPDTQSSFKNYVAGLSASYAATGNIRTALGLSSGNSPFVQRAAGPINQATLVREIEQGESLLDGLTRLSGNETEDPLDATQKTWTKDIPRVLHDDPSIRLQVEQALLERLILCPESGAPWTRLITESNGSIHIVNNGISDVGGSGKPAWNVRLEPLAREFSATELTPGTRQKIQNFYAQHGTVDGITNLTHSSFSPQVVDNLLKRVEWIIEKGRFPGASENKSY
jgi:hypothetical protein